MDFDKDITSTQEKTGTLAFFGSHSSQNARAFIKEIEALACEFTLLNLKEMDEVALLNRVDTKYVMPARDLLRIFPTLQTDYRILSVHGRCLNHYRTLYFDSPEFSLYRMHVNGQAERYKVRSREYIDTQLSYLEVKHHTRKERTIKERLETRRPVFMVTEKEESWLCEVFPYDSGSLEPKLWNTFTRITLVGRRTLERVTLDMDISFYAEERTAYLEGFVIAEVKFDSSISSSPFLSVMHMERLHPCGFSKYLMGVSMLYDQVKKNALKPKMLWLGKIAGGLSHEFVY